MRAGLGKKKGKRAIMSENAEEPTSKTVSVMQEIIELERKFYFEKRNVRTDRLRKVKDIIERHTPFEGE
ncbi:MAG: hypothetical protein ACI9TB_000508 [Parasphingorhabdus sp.]|jgi:hypothetical protein